MNGWMMAAIGLGFFGIAWAIDVLFSTTVLVLFTLAMLIGPPLVFESVLRVRQRLSAS